MTQNVTLYILSQRHWSLITLYVTSHFQIDSLLNFAWCFSAISFRGCSKTPKTVL